MCCNIKGQDLAYVEENDLAALDLKPVSRRKFIRLLQSARKVSQFYIFAAALPVALMHKASTVWMHCVDAMC